MNKKVGILIFLLIVLGLAGALVLVQQEQETRRGAAGFAPAVVQILPNSHSVEQSSDTVNVQILISAGSEKVTSADLKLAYDPGELEVVNAQLNEELFNYPVKIDYDSSPGDVWINGAAIVPPDEMPTGDAIKFAELTIKVKDTGTIRFDSSYENMVTGYNPGNDNKLFELDLNEATYTLEGSGATVTEEPEATATQAPTSIPPGEEDDTLTFLVSFLGIDDSAGVKYNPMVDVIIKQGYTTIQEVSNVTLQPAGEEKFKGTIALDQLGSDYSIFVKSKRHLSRKFCTDGQTSHCVGQGSIVLSEGDNQYDFSGLAMEPGDLNHPEQGQDDVIDTLDFSLAKAELQNTSGQSPADIDYSGGVNGRDLVLILGSLSTKHGELD
jgi:hypothetical protein